MLKKPIRPLLYNIKIKIYKNDKFFDSKLFEDFEKFEFWITQMKKIWKHKKAYNYKDLNYVEPILSNDTIIKIYQMFENNKELLLTTWIINDKYL